MGKIEVKQPNEGTMTTDMVEIEQDYYDIAVDARDGLFAWNPTEILMNRKGNLQFGVYTEERTKENRLDWEMGKFLYKVEISKPY